MRGSLPFVQIVFDARSRTETNCDWVIFYRDESRTVKLGDRYHGRNGSENFPGCGRRPVLWVTGDRCVAHFHSDGSTVDWGIKFTAYGLLSEEGEEGKGEEEEGRGQEEVNTQVALSCWLLEAFAREACDDVATLIYHRDTLDILRHSLTSLPRRHRVRLLHLLTSLLQEPRRLPPAEELTCLVTTLRALLASQVEAERTCHTKSRYLQALVQCLVSLRAAVLALTSPGGEAADLLHPPPEAVSSALLWGHGDTTGALGLSDDRQAARHIGKAGQRLLVQSTAALSGPTTWDVYIKRCANPQELALGLGLCGPTMPGGASGEKAAGLWFSADRVWTHLPGSEQSSPLPSGSLFGEGDWVTLRWDPATWAVDVERNGVNVGRLLGGGAGKAFVSFANCHVDHALSLCPAAILASVGDEVVLRPHVSSQRCPRLIELLHSPLPLSTPNNPKAVGAQAARRPSEGVREGEQWLADVCGAVDMLQSLAAHRTPLGLLAADFHPLLRASHSQVLQSTHPFDNLPATLKVHVPDAVALEVRVDEVTHLHDHDAIHVAAPGLAQTLPLLGPDCDAEPRPAQPTTPAEGPCPGDWVVRGSGWRYGDEDGGPGARGLVLRSDFFDANDGMGLRVRWAHGLEGLYRLGEVRLAPRAVSHGPLPHSALVTGDSLIVHVKPGQPPREAPPSFQGSLCFTPPSPPTAGAYVAVPAYSALDLDGDFTIELWLRLSAGSAKNGKDKCALSR